jgi:hypothetical protein
LLCSGIAWSSEWGVRQDVTVIALPQPLIHGSDHSRRVVRVDFGPPRATPTSRELRGDEVEISSVGFPFKRAAFIERESTLKEENVIVQLHLEEARILGSHVWIVAKPQIEGLGGSWFHRHAVVPPHSIYDFLPTRRPEGGCVLSHLYGEIHQRRDDSDAAYEISNISEVVENVRPAA